MPFAIVMETRAAERPTLRRVSGSQLQGAVLGFVKRLDPALSATMHDGRGYALAAPGGDVGRDHKRPIDALTLRVSSLGDGLFPDLLEALERGRRDGVPLTIDGRRFSIERIFPGAGHPWAGRAKFPDLVNLAVAAATHATVQLEFASPTVIAQGNRQEPLPVPENVFRGLANHWNEARGVPILDDPDAFQARVREHVVVKHYDCRTVIADMGDGLLQTGNVGVVTYRCLSAAAGEMSFWGWCCLLAEAGFYSGLGLRRTRGLGLIRVR